MKSQWTKKVPLSLGDSRDDTVAIYLQKNGIESCDERCDCLCHLRIRYWWKSPMVFRNIVGFFFLHYSSLWMLEPACTSQGCSKYSSRAFKITLCLPRRFLLKAAHFTAKMSPHGDPTFGLRIQRRTPEFATDSISHLSQRNNLAGIKDLLNSRIASPNDADDLNGFTPLHASITANPATTL